ncbi:MAG: hypothetical protein WBW81_01000 [Methylocella sp.]
MKRVRAAVSKNPAVRDPERAQEFGAAAFEKTQIRGVIDDTGKIRARPARPGGGVPPGKQVLRRAGRVEKAPS